jgi:hypothetical protein
VTIASLAPPTPRVTAWRDYAPDTHALDGMRLGEIEVPESSAEAAEQLWRMGARRARLPGVLDLTDEPAARRTVQALCLVRDLTARAVYVDWRPRLGPDTPWRPLSHLQPPAELAGTPGAAEELRDRRNGHYLGKCLRRQGPGFIQIRDQRWGALRRFTVDEPEYLEAVALLREGPSARRAPPSTACGRRTWWAGSADTTGSCPTASADGPRRRWSSDSPLPDTEKPTVIH